MAAEAGQLELNAFEPVIFYTLFKSIETLGHAAQTLTDNCILGITANEKHCKDLVNASAGIATALCPSIGYVPLPHSPKNPSRPMYQSVHSQLQKVM